MRLEFGDCAFDAEARLLTRAGRPVALSAKAFQLLELLLRRRPCVVSHAELRDHLWPRTAVGYTSLPRVVSETRRAIGDGRVSPLVRTVVGLGYAFSGPIVTATAPATVFPCTLRWREEDVPLREGENLIGRGLECTVRIDTPKVSRRHARIVVDGSRATLEDLGSKNGTYVGGHRLEGRVLLAAGDVIRVGAAVLVFRGGCGQGSTLTD